MNSDIFEQPVISLNSQGQGICSIDGFKIFVDNAITGDLIKGQITQKKKNYGLATLLEIQKKSGDRTTPICPLFEKCGGCQIMHLKYEKQLFYKTNKVLSAIKKIGGFEIEVNPCVASPKQLHYRNKIQLPIYKENGELKLGLYEKKSNTPLSINECFIHCRLGEKVFKEVSILLKETSLDVFCEESQRGFLRHLLIKTGVTTDECLVVWITSSKKHKETLKKISEKLISKCPEVKGVLINVNKKRYNSIMGDHCELLLGNPFIYERLLKKTFKVSAHSFFQVNPEQAENLYLKALNFADIKPDEVVLDAYCGTGTLSLLISSSAKKVIGIECVESAIRDAKENAALNQITNAEFILGTVENKIQQIEKVDTVFLNPPRKGCEIDVLNSIDQLRPKKIVYISCDPATLARDLKILSTMNYQLKEVQPFDMFPQTMHVETCALLTLLS